MKKEEYIILILLIASLLSGCSGSSGTVSAVNDNDAKSIKAEETEKIAQNPETEDGKTNTLSSDDNAKTSNEFSEKDDEYVTYNLNEEDGPILNDSELICIDNMLELPGEFLDSDRYSTLVYHLSRTYKEGFLKGHDLHITIDIDNMNMRDSFVFCNFIKLIS